MGKGRGVRDLDMIPETEKEAAVRNHRMFARVSCRVVPGRAKSSIRASKMQQGGEVERRRGKCFGSR